jgi:hypothetical protein
VSRTHVVEHTFRLAIAAGHGRDQRRPKSSNESVDNVENAGLTLVEAVDSCDRALLGKKPCCYDRLCFPAGGEELLATLKTLSVVLNTCGFHSSRSLISGGLHPVEKWTVMILARASDRSALTFRADAGVSTGARVPASTNALAEQGSCRPAAGYHHERFPRLWKGLWTNMESQGTGGGLSWATMERRW